MKIIILWADSHHQITTASGGNFATDLRHNAHFQQFNVLIARLTGIILQIGYKEENFAIVYRGSK
ncbi:MULTISPECIES: hypothetical protein [Larkinella]|uniref:hypothetical protein n=1 Tax=Larkinella TaxID=332157 RepID=UPI00105881F7|nr:MULTISPECIES: hypothetical protein [Larkinella]